MASLQDNIKKLNILFNKYNINSDDKEYLLYIIYNIFAHDEFQKRMSDIYPHHGYTTLGEHILEVTIVTFLLSKKYQKEIDYNMVIALTAAMLHDMYTLPWQNNKDAVVHHFFNKHGFRHPIESVINTLTWYPDLFSPEEKEIIIDSIIHHMFPLPVRVFSDSEENPLELKNFNLVEKLSNEDKKIIFNSSERCKVGGLSICPGLYKEGRVLTLADKMVSTRQINNMNTAISLVTGHNKSL